MKAIKIISLLTALMIGFISFKKEVSGTPVLTPSATTISANQEVIIKLSGVEASSHGYPASNSWTKVSGGPDFTTVSGGRKEDKTWTIKYSGTGTSTIQCSANFCRHGSCLGAKTAITTIVVQ